MSDVLIFDICVRGFGKRYKKYLELLGYRVFIVPNYMKDDSLIARFAKNNKGIIITTDKYFPYDRKIVLPMKKPKYEVWYTILIKKLRSII